MKSEVIIATGGEIESKINTWLKNNPNIIIHSTDLSVKNTSSSYLTYIILYNDAITI